MHLIYQLAEFKSTLPRKPQVTPNRHNRRSLGMMRSQTESSFMHPEANSFPIMSPIIAESSTAPLQKDQESISERLGSLGSPAFSQHTSSTSSGQITPGPSSAPSNVQRYPSGTDVQSSYGLWEKDVTMTSPLASPTPPHRMMDIDSNQTKSDAPPQLDVPIPISSPILPGGFSSMSLRRNAPRNLPFHIEYSSSATSKSHAQHPAIDHIMTDDVPITPSLLSPRAAEFTASPFHRTVAGDLAGSSIFEQGLLSSGSSEKDPRSPPTRGEAPITRSIDEVL